MTDSEFSMGDTPRDLKIVWLVSFGALVLAFPGYSLAVFYFELDRARVADIFSIQVTIGYWVGILAAFYPLPGLRDWSRFRRLQTVALTFMFVSFTTHMTWELIWVFAHDAISNARDSVWAYTWWAYIDGGDIRYANPETDFLMIEILSLCNGTVGFTGLYLLFRSRFADFRGTLLCMSTGVTHTVLTWYYYGTELLSGFDSVNTASFVDLWVKFILLNGPWLVFPWLVLAWGYQLLQRQMQLPGYHQ